MDIEFKCAILAKKQNKMEDFLMGKIYPFEMTHYAGDDYIPSSTDAIVESIIAAYKEDVSIKNSFEKALKHLLKSDNYSFVVAVRTVYFYKISSKYEKQAFKISSTLIKLMKEEYDKRCEAIRVDGITIYNGAKKYPTGDMRRMMSMMGDD